MFVCGMFASHPTIVTLICTQIHFVNILTLSTHSLDKALFAVHHRCRTSCSDATEITLTLPISGLSTCNYFWQIFCDKSSSTNFLRKINQAFQWTDHEVWKSHVIQTLPWCASILNCHTILSHHLEISPCCAVFLFVVLISLMAPNVLRECAQRLVETADFIRNTNWIAK